MGFGKKDWSKVVELEKMVNRLFIGVFSIEGIKSTSDPLCGLSPPEKYTVLKFLST